MNLASALAWETRQMEFDLIIRGGTVVTATDAGKSDIGVKDGRIVALADSLPRAASEIDASGLLVLPGGIDSHVHFDQPMGPGIVMPDGFESGTRSAAAGGNTTVLSFAPGAHHRHRHRRQMEQVAASLARESLRIAGLSGAACAPGIRFQLFIAVRDQ
jgi:dihydroorotase-like cyclic amidohydrolase